MNLERLRRTLAALQPSAVSVSDEVGNPRTIRFQEIIPSVWELTRVRTSSLGQQFDDRNVCLWVMGVNSAAANELPQGVGSGRLVFPKVPD
jgi:hypothetical protein